MSKRAKKRALDQKRQEEEEERLLHSKILQVKQEYE